MSAEPAFPEQAVRRFRAAYPGRPQKLAHQLRGHGLLELESIAELAQRLPAKDLEYNAGNLPIGISQHATPSNGLSVAETIRSIEENSSWMVLKRVEQDPQYRALLHAVLAELKEVIRPVTGEMLRLEGFIFVSSPRAVTPFHCDPEYNILCQLRGSKTITIFPAEDEGIAPQRFHERYNSGGQRNLEWRDEFAPLGMPVQLDPGDAVFVPLMAPHWVRNGDQVSISFSVTWRSGWSFRQADAHAFNNRLRRLGLDPAPPRRFPRDNLLKSVAQRALMKAERTLGAVRR